MQDSEIDLRKNRPYSFGRLILSTSFVSFKGHAFKEQLQFKIINFQTEKREYFRLTSKHFVDPPQKKKITAFVF